MTQAQAQQTAPVIQQSLTKAEKRVLRQRAKDQKNKAKARSLRRKVN